MMDGAMLKARSVVVRLWQMNWKLEARGKQIYQVR